MKAAEPAKFEMKDADSAKVEMKTKITTGEVVKVSKEEGLIVVKGKNSEDTYLVENAEWKGYKGVKEVAVSDVVTVTYADQDGEKIAKTVAKKAVVKKIKKK